MTLFLPHPGRVSRSESNAGFTARRLKLRFDVIRRPVTLFPLRPMTAAINWMLVVFLLIPALSAQVPLRVRNPGTTFSKDGPSSVVIDDVADGRRFRGDAFAEVKIKAPVKLPDAKLADPNMIRLVIHFRTSPSGPSLRSVELHEGSGVTFRLETNLKGNYSTSETFTPDVAANTWIFKSSPVHLHSGTTVHLKIQYPGGFDSKIDPGEFVLNSVDVEYPRKLSGSATLDPNKPVLAVGGKSSTPGKPNPVLAPIPPSPAGVIYALSDKNELLWYRHTGRDDGTFRWADSQAKTVGTGWNFKHIFSSGDGVIYAITETGDLLWYRHDGYVDGTFRWTEAEGKKVGTGWNYAHVFSGGKAIIYAITATGDLLWFRHSGRHDGTDRWANPEGLKVGTGWNVEHAFSGGDGVIYAVNANGELIWNRHEGRDDGTPRWAAPNGKKVGTGWVFKQVFSGGDGVIYAIGADNNLLWYRHDGRTDGSFRWAAPSGQKVGVGWAMKEVFSVQ